MAIDPYAPPPVDPESRMATRLADLERTVARLAAGASIVTTGTTAPGAAVTSKFYVDTVANRLYVRTAGGVYRYTVLT